MNILLLGDIHGRFDQADALYDVIRQVYKDRIDLMIQLGDFGFFPRLDPKNRWEREFDHPCWFIDGNHDDHEMLRELESDELVYGQWEYIPRGAIRQGILFIGGARSIDAEHRQRGLDWWPEENISYAEQEYILQAIDTYQERAKTDPEVIPIHTVISHDCPGGIDVSEACVYTGNDVVDGNRKFLQHVLDMVHPERWYFGHYHRKMSGTYRGCEWRCVDMIRHGGPHDFAFLEI